MNGGEETHSERDPCGWNPEPHTAAAHPGQVGPPACSPSGCSRRGVCSPGAPESCAPRGCHLEKVVPRGDLWKGAGGWGTRGRAGGACSMVRRPHSRPFCLPAATILCFEVRNRLFCLPLCIDITFKSGEAARPWCCLQSFLVVIRESEGWGKKSPLADVSNPK